MITQLYDLDLLDTIENLLIKKEFLLVHKQY